jgi:hypothetical protein
MDIIKTYRLLRKMSQYPNLTDLMRRIFLDVLEQRGIVTRERISAQVLEEMQRDDVPATEASRQEYLEALIDNYVAHSLTASDIENYINLARKRDNAQTLSMLANRDQATSEEVLRALREFCDIPKGEVYISLEEAEAGTVKRTKALARRQVAWFRRDPRIRWYRVGEDGAGAMVDELVEYLRDG